MRVGAAFLPALLCAGWTTAQALPVQISKGFITRDLTTNLEVLEGDECPSWPEIQAGSKEFRWHGGYTRPPHFGYFTACAWARFSLANDNFDADVFLDSRTPFMDSVTLHCTRGGVPTIQAAGDTHPFHQRALRHRFPSFRIHVPVQSVVTCYVRYDSTGLLVMPLIIQTLEQAHNSALPEYAGFGFYFGGMVVLLLYNFFVFMFARHSAYFWGCLVLFCIAANHAFATGFLIQFFFPDSTLISNSGSLFSSAGFSLCAYFFGRTSMEVDGSRFRRFDIAVFLMFTACLIVGSLLSMRAAMSALNVSYVIIMSINVWRGARGVRGGLFALPYFLAGWILALASAWINVLYNFGAVPFLPAQAALVMIPVATIFEGIFFTFALSRIRKSQWHLGTITSNFRRTRDGRGPGADEPDDGSRQVTGRQP